MDGAMKRGFYSSSSATEGRKVSVRVRVSVRVSVRVRQLVGLDWS